MSDVNVNVNQDQERKEKDVDNALKEFVKTWKKEKKQKQNQTQKKLFNSALLSHRRATESDAEQIVALFAEAATTFGLWALPSVASIQCELADSSIEYRVFEDDKGLIGCCKLVSFDPDYWSKKLKRKVFQFVSHFAILNFMLFLWIF